MRGFLNLFKLSINYLLYTYTFDKGNGKITLQMSLFDTQFSIIFHINCMYVKVRRSYDLFP